MMNSSFYNQISEAEQKRSVTLMTRSNSPNGQAIRCWGYNRLHRQIVTPQPWEIFQGLLTITLSTFIHGQIKICEVKGNPASVQKNTLDTLSTALILGVGLEVFAHKHEMH